MFTLATSRPRSSERAPRYASTRASTAPQSAGPPREPDDDEAALDAVRVSALGKKGSVSLMMRELGKMTPEQRQQAGPALNALKDELNSALAARRAALSDAALAERLQTSASTEAS